jgi:hypothetical protein
MFNHKFLKMNTLTPPPIFKSFGKCAGKIDLSVISKRSKMIVCAAAMFYSLNAKAQTQWLGSPTDINNIYRTGNVGIGTTTPNFPLSFGTGVANTKIALYENNATDVYGIGLLGSQLRFHVGNSSARFSFLSSATGGAEVMTIRGAGGIGLNQINPTSTLSVNGGVAIGSTFSSNFIPVANNSLAVQGSISIGSIGQVGLLEMANPTNGSNPFFRLLSGTSDESTLLVGVSAGSGQYFGISQSRDIIIKNYGVGTNNLIIANERQGKDILFGVTNSSAQEAMRITSTGRVGIGTSNLATGIRLQVQGGGIAQITSGVLGNIADTWSTLTTGNNINILPGFSTFFASNGSIFGLNANSSNAALNTGVLSTNSLVNYPVICNRALPGAPLLFGSLDNSNNFREQMSLTSTGELFITGQPLVGGLGSKLEVYGGNITQVSSGSPALQTNNDIFTSIGGRLGTQPPPQAPGINAQGLRTQWGRNAINIGMTDFDNPAQTTIKNALISWQDFDVTGLDNVRNRLVIGFRDQSAGTNAVFREVATFNSKSNFGVGTSEPGSRISSSGNMSVGTNFGNIGAPLNGLIVEGRVGIGTSNPTATFSGQVNLADPNNSASGNIALHVVGGGILCNTYGVGSDARIKRNVKPIESSLNLLKQLKGVNYEVNLTASTEKETWMPSSGFIAQEVKEVLPQVVMNLDNGYLALNYDAIIPVIVEALKEQQEIIEKQQQEITLLKNGENGSNRVQSLEQAGPTTKNKLEQNIPNPFSGTTVIRYSWVEGNRASLMIFDLNGTTVHKLENLAKGDQELSLELSNLASGLYYYSLVVDGAESITKRMVLNK